MRLIGLVVLLLLAPRSARPLGTFARDSASRRLTPRRTRPMRGCGGSAIDEDPGLVGGGSTAKRADIARLT